MADALDLNMPVEFELELMAIVGSNFPCPEGELVDDIVDEVDGTCLSVALLDLHGPEMGRIIDGCKLIALELLPLFSRECLELDVHLNVMTGNLLVELRRVSLERPGCSQVAVQSVTAKYRVNAGICDCDAMVSLQVPDNPGRAEMVFSAKVKDPFHGLVLRLVGMAFGHARA